MNAGQIMTRKVVTVSPSATVREVARCLADHRVSAVPVVDHEGAVVGVISEGDLMTGTSVARDERGAWWLEMLAEGERLAPEFMDYVRSGGKLARDLMTRPAVTAGETTPVAELARLLESRRIKRVPIVRDRMLVGVVSRADLVRALAHHEDRYPGTACGSLRAQAP
jgi:CBS domain-containing protein